MKFRGYRDDATILRLADADGCGMTLRAMLARLDGTMKAVLTDRRVYLAHCTPGDAGYSMFECDSPLDMPELLASLAPVIGPTSSMTLKRHDNDPNAQGARH